jgi:hypothetical protein
MKVLKINRIRVWNPHSARVSERWFWKSEALIGSDRKCGIRIHELQGLMARIDFDQKEIIYIDSGKIENLKVGELFQIGTYVFQWSELDLSKTISLGTLVSIVSIFAFSILLLIWNSRRVEQCGHDAFQLTHGPWKKSSPITGQLFEKRIDFRRALDEKSWLKALAELNSIREMISSPQVPKACLPASAFEKLELEFAEKIIRDYLSKNELERAANELKKIGHLNGADGWNRLRKIVLNNARSVYLKGYRMDDESSDEAQGLMDNAESVCLALSLSSRCFLQQTSHQRVPSLERPSLE